MRGHTFVVVFPLSIQVGTRKSASIGAQKALKKHTITIVIHQLDGALNASTLLDLTLYVVGGNSLIESL